MRNFLVYVLLFNTGLLFTGFAVPFPHTVKIQTDTVFDFHLIIEGNDITEDNDDDEVPLGPLGNNWTVNLKLIPDDGAFNDTLKVEGTIHHNPFVALPDHVHATTIGGEWEFKLAINADDGVGGLASDVKGAPRFHNSHVDTYTATLVGFTPDNDEFTSWRFELRGNHPRTSQLPDTGSSAGLFAISIGVLVLMRRYFAGNPSRSSPPRV